MATRYIGIATFNGTYSFFSICFRPNGFNKIFGLPLHGITNHIIAAEDILDSKFKNLFEQLYAARDLNEMAILTNAYLLKILKKHKRVDHKDAITVISNQILKTEKPINVMQLANSANMCLRNFERHFSEEVGMPPKLFNCVARFNRAFEIKLKYPQKCWTSIALKCGYFDQMHLVKDFKRFSGYTPATFLKQTPLFVQDYVSRIEF